MVKQCFKGYTPHVTCKKGTCRYFLHEHWGRNQIHLMETWLQSTGPWLATTQHCGQMKLINQTSRKYEWISAPIHHFKQ